MSLEFAIIKDDQIAVTINPDEFSNMIISNVEAGINKNLSGRGKLSSKKFTHNQMMSIVNTAVQDTLTSAERILKVRRKP